MQIHTPNNCNYENQKNKSKDKGKEVGSHSCMGTKKLYMKRFHVKLRPKK
jgi:hypothetical protein